MEASPLDLAIRHAWWLDFGCYELDSLVRIAFQDSPELRVSAARVQQAAAMPEVIQADEVPALNLLGGFSRARPTGFEPTQRSRQLGLQASWELDLAGRRSLDSAAAGHDVQAAELSRQATELALAGAIAAAYFQIKQIDRRLQIAEEARELQAQRVFAARRRVAAGQVAVTELDAALMREALHEGYRQRLIGARREGARQLALLLGGTQAPALSGPLHWGLFNLALVPEALDAGLLDRRIDMQAHARTLDAAMARHELAKTDLFPRLVFDWTRRQVRIGDGGGATAIALGFGLQLYLPLVDGGRIRANIRLRHGQVEEAFAVYRAALLKAMADADSSLLRFNAAVAAVRSLRGAVASAERLSANAQALFASGQTSLDASFDARAAVCEARDALAQAELDLILSAIAVRRAFGGTLDSA